jgi:hypothetical protein
MPRKKAEERDFPRRSLKLLSRTSTSELCASSVALVVDSSTALVEGSNLDSFRSCRDTDEIN